MGPAARRGRGAFIVGFLAPAVLLYAAFVILPICQSVVLSLYNWRGVSQHKQFVGLKNFSDLSNDDIFIKALKHNLWTLAIAGIVIVALSVAVAHAMQGSGRIGRSLRGVYLFPQVVSVIVVGILWQFLYNPAGGPIARLLGSIGIGKQSGILGDPKLALPALVVAFIWYSAGFYIMLFAAGLQSIPAEVTEAAELDGSHGMHKFWTITWPMLWSVKRVAIVYIAINVMNIFGLAYVMTESGGPDNATEFMLTYLYRKAFEDSQFGRATAIAVVNFVVAMLIALAILIVMRRDPQEPRRIVG